METNSKEYMVHYNGWSNKWNELVPESRLKIRSDNATFGESGASQVKSTEPDASQGEIPIQVTKKPAKKQDKSAIQRHLRQTFVCKRESLEILVRNNRATDPREASSFAL